jgi:hypothetical protein
MTSTGTLFAKAIARTAEILGTIDQEARGD